MRILIVEDDLIIGKNVETALKEEGFEVVLCRDGAKGETVIRDQNFDCVVLDINLPGKSGFELCRDLRKRDQRTPVILLTAFDELEDKVQGFENGANDYLTKPFYMKELSLRVNALIKRNVAAESSQSSVIEQSRLCLDDLEMDLREKKVKRAGQDILLTPREFQILRKLLEAQGAPVSKKELVKEIWGSLFDHNTNTIEVYVNFLRNKIDKPFDRQLIKTRIGYGYFIDINSRP